MLTPTLRRTALNRASRRLLRSDHSNSGAASIKRRLDEVELQVKRIEMETVDKIEKLDNRVLMTLNDVAADTRAFGAMVKSTIKVANAELKSKFDELKSGVKVRDFKFWDKFWDRFWSRVGINISVIGLSFAYYQYYRALTTAAPTTAAPTPAAPTPSAPTPAQTTPVKAPAVKQNEARMKQA